MISALIKSLKIPRRRTLYWLARMIEVARIGLHRTAAVSWLEDIGWLIRTRYGASGRGRRSVRFQNQKVLFL